VPLCPMVPPPIFSFVPFPPLSFPKTPNRTNALQFNLRMKPVFVILLASPPALAFKKLPHANPMTKNSVRKSHSTSDQPYHLFLSFPELSCFLLQPKNPVPLFDYVTHTPIRPGAFGPNISLRSSVPYRTRAP